MYYTFVCLARNLYIRLLFFTNNIIRYIRYMETFFSVIFHVCLCVKVWKPSCDCEIRMFFYCLLRVLCFFFASVWVWAKVLLSYYHIACILSFSKIRDIIHLYVGVSVSIFISWHFPLFSTHINEVFFCTVNAKKWQPLGSLTWTLTTKITTQIAD